jgi:hypothetical protein
MPGIAIWQVIAGLGVGGLAVFVFWLVVRRFGQRKGEGFETSRLTTQQSFVVAILILFAFTTVTIIALVRFSPSRSPALPETKAPVNHEVRDPVRPLKPGTGTVEVFPHDNPDKAPVWNFTVIGVLDPPSTNNVEVYFGGCLAVVPLRTNGFPLVVAVDRSKKKTPLIAVSAGTNDVMVSGQFFDKDGKIVAVLKDNKPIINPLTSFNVERPDDSTLIVRDQYNVEVLNIRFVNPKALVFTGAIRAPDGGREAIVTKSQIVFMKDGIERTA